jgi:hypothetical protein
VSSQGYKQFTQEVFLLFIYIALHVRKNILDIVVSTSFIILIVKDTSIRCGMTVKILRLGEGMLELDMS